jgi:hypothetical protein
MATVTCHTPGCENNGIPLEVVTEWTDTDGNEQTVDNVQCGACGREIRDVDPPLGDHMTPHQEGQTDE